MTYKEDNELSNFLTKSQITGFLLLKKKKNVSKGAWSMAAGDTKLSAAKPPGNHSLWEGC